MYVCENDPANLIPKTLWKELPASENELLGAQFLEAKPIE